MLVAAGTMLAGTVTAALPGQGHVLLPHRKITYSPLYRPWYTALQAKIALMWQPGSRGLQRLIQWR